jgi:hypothetical protein
MAVVEACQSMTTRDRQDFLLEVFPIALYRLIGLTAG